ncbi:hypothetical protein [Myroides phaeus]|uniref:Uncharacterized protein n=1 Tax=Myroides phaeus TaxID=702745 RepID=A0A1G8G9Z6_9FLAO|nr:hypothetical protein [Myroides phaeus]SDH91205.1 hypothetical protein SAMN05421818_12423 [Myroides phaeus]
MKKRSIVYIVVFILVGFITSCEEIDFWRKDCYNPTKVSQSEVSFENYGGEAYIDVTPQPFVLYHDVPFNDGSGIVASEVTTEYGTKDYRVMKTADRRLLIKAFPNKTGVPIEFEVKVEGGDCSKTIKCRIKE